MASRGRFYLDRVEEGVAVIIYGDGEFTLPAAVLPDGASEGDYIRLELTIDDDARSAAEAETGDLQRRLLGKKDAGGTDDSE